MAKKHSPTSTKRPTTKAHALRHEARPEAPTNSATATSASASASANTSDAITVKHSAQDKRTLSIKKCLSAAKATLREHVPAGSGPLAYWRYFWQLRNAFVRRHRRAIIGANIGLFVVAILVLVVGMHVCAPDLRKYYERSHVLYDGQNNIIYAHMAPGDFYRIRTTVDDVDPLYLKMLIAAEDERFFHHWGVDPFAMGRAMLSNLQAGNIVSGASTLTMQVCRLLEPKERSILSKAEEALGALYLTYYMGREEVLNMYLTMAPFGGNIEGVTAASYMYFNHGPQKLSPDEAALLVALPRAPEAMRPDLHPEKARYYRHAVLQRAYEQGFIAADVLAAADAQPLPTRRYPLPQSAYHLGQSLFSGKLEPPEMRSIARQALAEAIVTAAGDAVPEEVGQTIARVHQEQDQSGIGVPTELYSTIDPLVQNILNDIARRYQEQYSNDSEESIALLAVDNRDFSVLGYVGSPCVQHSYVDAVQALRSPGSALKPFAYAMAFEDGLLHPNSLLLDISRLYGAYQPRNYDRKFFGEMTAARALQGSINLPALEVMQAVGATQFVSRLNQFPNAVDKTDHSKELKTYQHGRLHLAPQTQPHLGVILGAVDISLYDLTQLYAALAHDGQIAPLHLINGHTAQKAQLAMSTYQRSAHVAPVSGLEVTASGEVEEAAATITATTTTEASNDTLARDAVFLQKQTLHTAPLLHADAARATYIVLEGTPVPHGHLPAQPVSYKTGTSYKYRDAVAIGSKGGVTVGIWTGRLDGDARQSKSAYETVAPWLFTALEQIPLRPVTKEPLTDSVLLQPQPPQALTKVEIASLGQVFKRANSGSEQDASQVGSLGTPPVEVVTDLNYKPLALEFPLDGGRLQVGASGQVMVRFSGGHGPYYVLVNDVLQEQNSFFTPQHNGFYTVTVIDSAGDSVSHQVLVQGMSDSTEALSADDIQSNLERSGDAAAASDSESSRHSTVVAPAIPAAENQ